MGEVEGMDCEVEGIGGEVEVVGGEVDGDVGDVGDVGRCELSCVGYLESRWERRRRYVDGLFARFRRVEWEIREIGRLLRYSQPLGEGKLGVRWWKTQVFEGGGWLIEPVLVRWVKTKGRVGGWRPVRLRGRPKKIYDRGRWGLCAEETKVLVEYFFVKYGEWKVLYGLIREATDGRFERRMKTVFRRGVEVDLEGVRERIDQNLRSAGYMGVV